MNADTMRLRQAFESWALHTPPDERTNWEVFQAGANAAAQCAAEGDELPPLPEAPVAYLGLGHTQRLGYTADQMRAYARAAQAHVQPKGTDLRVAFEKWWPEFLESARFGYEKAGVAPRPDADYDKNTAWIAFRMGDYMARAAPSPAPAPEPTLPVEIWGKTYEVPIPVQVHITRLQDLAEFGPGGPDAPCAAVRPRRVSDDEIRAWVGRHDFGASLGLGDYRAMVEDARTIELAAGTSKPPVQGSQP